MNVSETLSEGLKRGFEITVPSSELESDIENRLLEISKSAKMKGFRPGKVPISIIRRQYRPSVLGEVIERTIQATTQKAMEDRKLRPALQPKIEITEYSEGKDLQYKLDIEILPEVKLDNLSDMSLVRSIAEVSESNINDGVQRIADADKQYDPISTPRAAEVGDALLVDFKGSIEGTEIDGAKAEDFQVELGSGSFIPGFEEQLVGVKVGEKVEVNVTFPDNYPQEDAAGKPALFEVDIKEIRERSEVIVNDDMAKKHGFDNLEALKEMVKERLGEEFEQASKSRLKRSLLDALADQYTFPVPEGMVEQEYEVIWEQVKKDLEQSKSSYEDVLGKSEEEAQLEYKGIAERRVRLGLLLSEIGSQNNISVERDDLLNAALEGARGMSNPQQVLDYYKTNPNALERFRAPVFEDKVVTFVTELASVTDNKVSSETLFQDPDEESHEDENSKNSSKGKKSVRRKNTSKSAGSTSEKSSKSKTTEKPKRKSIGKNLKSTKGRSKKSTPSARTSRKTNKD